MSELSNRLPVFAEIRVGMAMTPAPARNDDDAFEIGQLYQKSRGSLVDSVNYAIECGKILTKKKASLPHGEWLPWLEQNADVLGFETPRTPQRLMALAANATSTSLLDGPSAITISRQLWGNDNTRGTQGTGDNEWNTPAEYIEVARKVLGVIEIDPASNSLAQATVHAEKFFTKEDDGLSKSWNGKVWLNPPYAQPLIENFADKMIAEIGHGNVSQAIMLTHNYTDTKWFQKLAAKAQAICFTRGRIRFESPLGERGVPTQGQAFFFFGFDTARFTDEFSQIGFVVSRLVTEGP